MASNPPFQVEDQTDEDFFDKLVDDDDEYKVTPSVSHSFVDGNDSDEAKAFANLSIAKAYDQHLNMILGDVEEIVTTVEIDDETYEEIVRSESELMHGSGGELVENSRKKAYLTAPLCLMNVECIGRVE
ncbi:Sm-like protein LSM3A [Camellia lanceoleosa]|uniref:Sm-like protein LSM3A n=1 Tax=Camellia lanceoleosa TaxID=1840588 RepID=A0ACC0J4R2_9ERIC|nr:Sm-like protein LSM3A [Camellia lanceoleosa]